MYSLMIIIKTILEEKKGQKPYYVGLKNEVYSSKIFTY